jgi:hypothetical protein
MQIVNLSLSILDICQLSIVYSIALTVANLTSSSTPITLSGEGQLPGGHRSFVKPAGHNTWIDDQPDTVDEGSGTSTQHIIVIEVSVIVLYQM